MWNNSERVQMKKVKDTIKNTASYSSGDALKMFSQCAEIQLTLRANFMTSLSSHVLWRQGCTSTRLKMSEPVTIYDTLLWCLYEFWFHCSGFFLTTNPLVLHQWFLARPVDFCWNWASRPTKLLCLTLKGNNFDQQKYLEDQPAQEQC